MTLLEAALFGSAMVVALVSGLYAGLGLNAEADLDRRAELWFAAVMWAAAGLGAFIRGNLGTGMVLGGLVLLLLWSFLHFPNVKTLETPMPRRTPLLAMTVCLVTTILLGLAIFLG